MANDAVTTAQRRFAVHSTPHGWSAIRLGEVFDSIVDRGHSEELPVLSVTLDRGVVRRSSLDRSSEREVDRDQYLRAAPGDIAYNTMRMWQGGSGLVRENGYLSPAYTICRPRVEECSDFWAHSFKSPEMIRSFLDHSQGVAKDRFRLYYHHFATVPALRPPTSEQRKIAAILSSLDEAIKATQAVIDQLGVVKKAMMAELFTRGLPGRHTKFKQTEIGELPEGWTTATYGELAADLPAAIQSGPFGSELRHSEFQADGRLVIGIDNVQDGKFSIGRNNRISEEKFVGLQRFQARPLDLLITVMATVGRCCVVPVTIEPSIITKHVYRLSPDLQRVNPYFLMYCLYGIERLAVQLRGSAQGLSRPGLNKSLLMPLCFPVPSLDEQLELVSLIRSFDERIEVETSVVESLLSAKSALLSVLLTGELRVKTDEAAP